MSDLGVSSFFAELGPSYREYKGIPHPQTAAEVDVWCRNYEERCGSKRDGTLIDMCCGFGRHALEFLRRGWQVVGVDHEKTLIDIAQAEARKCMLPGAFVVGDALDPWPTLFDMALLLGNSFGFYSEDEENRIVLRNLINATRPGGLVGLDCLDGAEERARLSSSGGKAYSVIRPQADVNINKVESLDHSGNIKQVDVRCEIHGRAFEASYGIRLYSANEVVKILRSLGLTEVRVGAAGSSEADLKRYVRIAGVRPY